MVPINKKQLKIFFPLLVLLLLPLMVQAQIYVDGAATGSNDGTSWSDAFNYLQDALDDAGYGDEIWVAEGTYYPDEGSGQTNNDRTSTFNLNDAFGAYIYGGFNGTESSLNQRILHLYETILSGEIQQDGDNTNNAYHVVTGYAATIDGLTITAGYADGIDPANKGGGIYNPSAYPDIYKCTIKNNNAVYGGGIYNDGADPVIKNCIFLNNTATQDGGAMYTTNGSNPTIYNCSFSNNTASNNGDGLYNASSPNLIINCILWGSDDQINGSANTSVIYSDVQWSGTGGYYDGSVGDDYRNIEQDPDFKNAKLILNAGSPCLGTGSPWDTLDVPATDILGHNRPLPISASNVDMGAYEQNNDGSLPVELSLFSASYENGRVILSWRTESEVDQQGFILERKKSKGSYHIIASYETHPELKSQGNTSSRTEYKFIDQDVHAGTTYYYRLSDVSTQGDITTYPALSITLNALPIETILDNAYPNPFNPQTYIGYHLNETTEVYLTVLDMLGRKVKNLYQGKQNTGNYHVYWNGKDDSGYQCPSGMYIIQLQTVAITKTQKVMLLK